MVVLLSQNNEHSTDEVIQYLLNIGIAFIRINEEDIITDIDICLNSDKNKTEIKFANFELSLEKVTAFWYRRGKISFCRNEILPLIFPENKYYQSYSNYLRCELKHLSSLIYDFLVDVKSIGDYRHNYLSKLKQLKTAMQSGLCIPKTVISTSLKNISGKEWVIKAMDYDYFTTNNKESKVRINHVVKVNNLKKSKFLPTKFQEYLDKKYEIRIFYLHGEFYPMCIFSQENEKTKLDFRNYDYINPNRNVPFKLPSDLEEKLDNLMHKLDLNSGSIDMVYTRQGEFVFLEVNPIGQFDWLSKNCNYHIPKIIAEYLADVN